MRSAVVAGDLCASSIRTIRFRPDRDDAAGRTRAHLDGTALGHPLLPAARMVRNDVRLDRQRPAARHQRLQHVRQEHRPANRRHQRRAGTGRRAGARAQRSRCRRSPSVRTLRIQDSLLEGRSRFYAEITRIRAIVDVARRTAAAVPARRAVPRDELARSLRRRDRRAAQSDRSRRDRPDHHARSRAHGIAAELAPHAENVHFEDRLRGRRDALRLPDEAGTGDAQQRPGTDARGRTRRRGRNRRAEDDSKVRPFEATADTSGFRAVEEPHMSGSIRRCRRHLRLVPQDRRTARAAAASLGGPGARRAAVHHRASGLRALVQGAAARARSRHRICFRTTRAIAPSTH